MATDEWQDTGQALQRDLRSHDFAEAMAYVKLVAQLADESAHHPDVLIHGWNRVRLTLFSPSEGRITEADRAMAARIDELG